MATRLTQQVQAALPQTGATVGPEEIDEVLTALSWFTDGKERYEAKGSFPRTSERDTLERSLGINILLGNLPTMVRETAWYPLAYPEAEMRHCPQGHTGPANEIPMETQAHFMQCEAGECLPPPTPHPGLATRTWEHEYVCQRTSWMCITAEMKRDAEEAIRAENEWPREKEVPK
ncbi:hypothetical protein J3B02_005092, partial [Coemansia erecta]